MSPDVDAAPRKVLNSNGIRGGGKEAEALVSTSRAETVGHSQKRARFRFSSNVIGIAEVSWLRNGGGKFLFRFSSTGSAS